MQGPVGTAGMVGMLGSLARIEKRSMAAGLAGLVLLAAGGFFWTDQFFRSYLYGYLFWIGLTLGCLGILILHHLVSGAWGHIIQRMVESGARTLPAMAVLFLPIAFGAQVLYPWTDESIVAASHVVSHKAGYLNLPMFYARLAVYFMVWIAVSVRLTRWSVEQDRTGDAAITRRMKIFSGPSAVLFVLTVTLASVDWMMSLEPEWYSTIYGMATIVGAVLTALSFCVVLLFMFSKFDPYAKILTTRHSHHIGNLIFAFTILWAYMAFSQYLIIWSGNLPEDNSWYIRRTGNGWNILAVILLVGHFFIPFLVMLSRKSKRVLRSLFYVALWLLLMRLFDLFWLIAPAFTDAGLSVHPLDIVAPAAIGGIWLTLFVSNLKKAPIIPLKDPRFGPDGFHIHDID